jgi:hypothetical protein
MNQEFKTKAECEKHLKEQFAKIKEELGDDLQKIEDFVNSAKERLKSKFDEGAPLDPSESK